MLINQSFVPILKDQAEIIETGNLPFDLFSRDEFNDYGDPLLPHSIEKLILYINLISNHCGPLSIDGSFDGIGFGSIPV
jgi:hypothetical protein